MHSVPQTMRALELRSREGALPRPVLVDRPVPTPKHGEVLVRIAAAPINPNDLLFLRDAYEVQRTLPAVPGFEGSGTVVASGGGVLARLMMGRRVACAAAEGDGTWAEYAAIPVLRCAPLRGGTDLEAGATMLTNPMSAFVLATQAHREGHRAVVLTAAAGALGRMLGRLLGRQGQAVIGVVRRAAQVEQLHAEGAEHVLDSSAPSFEQELRTLAARLGATLALDAVGGELTGRLFAALPRGSVVRVYGMLSDEACRIEGAPLVFEDKRLEGFTMYQWLRTTSLFRQLRTMRKVQGLLGDVLQTKVRARFGLDQCDDALAAVREGTSDGKVLLVPDRLL